MNARLGIDLGGSKIAGVVLDANDAVRVERRVQTPKGNYQATIRAIADLVVALENAAGACDLPVGVGTPGSVVPATGRIHNANSACLNGQPLARDLQIVLNRPVRLANDADCLALSEAHDGAAMGVDSVFAVILGTGVGGGIVVDGRLLGGPNGLSGEWGHTPLPWMSAAEHHARTCWCGLQDCLETWLSGPALLADFRQRGGQAADARSLVAQAQAGDACAEATLDAWFDRLARALAHIVNVLDPHMIVIGGGLSRIERLYTEVPRRWSRYAFTDHVVTALRPAVHGDASGVRGAARL